MTSVVQQAPLHGETYRKLQRRYPFAVRMQQAPLLRHATPAARVRVVRLRGRLLRLRASLVSALRVDQC